MNNENDDLNVNLTHKTDIKIVSPVKQFLSRFLNVSQVGLTLLCAGGGIGTSLVNLVHNQGFTNPELGGLLAFGVISPFVIHATRKTIDYLLNL